MTVNKRYIIFLMGLTLVFPLKGKDRQVIDPVDSLLINLPDTAKISKLNLMISREKHNSLEQSLIYANKALEIAESLNNPEILSETYLQKGIIYAYAHLYEDALNFYKRSLDIKDSLNDSSGIKRLYHNMALACFFLKDTTKSHFYFEKALELSESMADSSAIGADELNLAEFYFKTGNLPEAKNHYLRSISILEETKDSYNLVQDLIALGEIETLNSNYTEARKYLVRGNTIAQKAHLDKEIAYTGYLMGQLFKKLDESELAKQHLQGALSYARDKGLLDLEKKILLSLSTFFQQQNNFKQAYKYYTDFIDIKDSVQSNNRNQQVSFLKMKYDTERKKNELKLLQKTNLLQNEKLQKQKRNQLFIWILIFLALIVAGISLRFFFLRRKTYILLNQKSELLKKSNLELIESEKSLQTINITKNKIFSIMAENLITPFRELVDMAGQLHSGTTQLSLTELKKLSNDIYHTSKTLHGLLENLLHWSRLQTGKIILQPEETDVSKLCNHTISNNRINADLKGIHLKQDLATTCKVFVDPNLLEVILNNLIRNAIKYTPENGNVWINLLCSEESPVFTITDSGRGISIEDQKKLFRNDSHFTHKGTSEEQGVGLGLLVAKGYIELMGGRIELESTPGIGSSFKVVLPYPNKKNDL